MNIIRTFKDLAGNEFPLEAGSAEWFKQRIGRATASEFKNLVSDTFKIRSGDMPVSYLYTKLAEKWRGLPLADFTAWDTEIGKIREREAIPAYEVQFSEEIERVPFITTDDGSIGCSPDGLIKGAEMGIEVKCLQPQNHLKILMSGEMPSDYAAQVHGSLLVTGFHAWKFMSYCPGFPTFVTLIERDEAIQEVLKKALESFKKTFSEQWERLVNMNGGLPKYLQPKANPQSQPIQDIYV